MPPYQVRTVHDRFGRVVGFLDGQFVLGSDRRVMAEVRFGTVLRYDGRICGEFDGVHFVDRRRAVVATTATTATDALPTVARERFVEAEAFGTTVVGGSLALLEDAPGRVEWSSLDWHRYVEV